MENQKFRILSIDGGGIRGAFPARFLAELEADLEAPVASHFDLICGTSTGGILALGLALGIPAKKLEALYVENRRDIFPKPYIKRWRSGWLRSKYTNKRLEEIIRKSFADYHKGFDPRLEDLQSRVCIPGYDLLNAKPKVFKTPHKHEYHIDKHIPAYQVAMATSAAPTYFNPYSNIYKREDGEMREFQLKVDGGVFANNPSFIGLTEAHCGLGLELEDIELISVGTGKSTVQESRTHNLFSKVTKNFGKIYWISNSRIVDILMQAQAQHVADLCSIYAGGTGATKAHKFNYIRIQTDIPKTLKVGLDCSDIVKIKKLLELANNEYQKHGRNVVDLIESSSSWGGYPFPDAK